MREPCSPQAIVLISVGSNRSDCPSRADELQNEVDAIYITTGGFGTALNVKRGDGGFQMRLGGFKKDQAMAIEKALASEVLKKM